MSEPSSENIVQSMRIRRYRVFEDIEIAGLSRINLVTGRNGSGKTSLLEAMFLLSCAGNPEALFRPIITRATESTTQVRALSETFWKPLFLSLDTKRAIEIEARHSVHGPLSLNLFLEKPDAVEVSLNKSEQIPVQGAIGDSDVVFQYKVDSGEPVVGRIHAVEEKFQNTKPNIPVPFPAISFSTQLTSMEEIAHLLGRLRKRKQGHLLLDALRIVEPRLQGIEDNSSSGAPMIWGDIGLPELVPLSMMGESMVRIARLVLGISSVPGGVLLADEIETGLHHSVLPNVWRVVDAAARQFDAQVIATTHSIECMRAAGAALIGNGGLSLHRLEASESGNRCVTYDEDDIGAAIDYNFEVR